MDKYKMNLDGIQPGDKVKCFNGDTLLITSFTNRFEKSANANLISRKEQGSYKSFINTIEHSEINNNCWKFYSKK